MWLAGIGVRANRTGDVRRRPVLLVIVMVAWLIVATGCSEPDDAPTDPDSPTPSAGQEDKGDKDDALDQIADLPTVSLRTLELPDVPDDMDPVDVRTAADTVRAMALDSFNNRTRWDAKPTPRVQRSHLAIGGPRLAGQVHRSKELAAGQPTAQLFVTIFAPDAQPTDMPRVVGAAWQVEKRNGSDDPQPMVSLQVHAMYTVGDEANPVPILVRRTIGIGGEDLGALETKKSWLAETQLVGADPCIFYKKGFLAPAKQDPPTEAYEKFLTEAETEEQDDPPSRTPRLARLRAQACR